MPLLAEGVKAEAQYKKDGTLPDPTSTDNPEFKIVLQIIKDGLSKNPDRWTKLSKSLVGESPGICLLHLSESGDVACQCH